MNPDQLAEQLLKAKGEFSEGYWLAFENKIKKINYYIQKGWIKRINPRNAREAAKNINFVRGLVRG